MACSACGHELMENAVFCPRCGQAVEGASECLDYSYEAFVSYRHRPADRKVAVRLQRFLEGFRIPSKLNTDRADAKLGKLFRDEDELPTSSSLTEQIEDALQHARCLVVVCSPEAKGSLWVQREVEMFASLHGRSRIFLALVEGEPEDSFPPLLLKRLEAAPDGSCREIDEEPLAADFRTSQGKKFRPEAQRIAAALIGCSYDDLRQRLRARRMARIAAAAALVALVSVAFGAFSWYQQQQIQENHREALRHESELLAVEAEELLNNGDRYQAIQVALSALPQGSEDGSRPFVPAAALVLQRATGLYPTSGYWSPLHSFALSSDSSFLTSEYDMVATQTTDGDVAVRETYFGKVLFTVKKDELLASVAADDADFGGAAMRKGYMACLYGSHVFCIDLKDGSTAWSDEGRGQALLTSIGDSYVSVLYGSRGASGKEVQGALVMYDVKDGKRVQSFDVDDASLQLGLLVMADDEGSTVAFRRTVGEDLQVVNSAGDEHVTSLAGATVENIYFKDGMVYVLSSDEVGSGPMYVEAFDSSLSRRWRYDGTADLSYDSNGFVDATNNRIVGIDPNQDDDCLVVILSTTVLGLDAATGAELHRVSFNKPVLDCCIDLGVSFVVLSDGAIMSQIGLFRGKGFVHDSLTQSDLVQAKFEICPGVGLLLVGRSVGPGRVIVACMGDTLYTKASRTDLEHIAKDSSVFVEQGIACASSADGLLFLNEELEKGKAVSSNRMPLLDWSNQVVVSVSKEGKAYAWGHALKDASALAIYPVSPEGDVGEGRVVEKAYSAAEVANPGLKDARDRWAFVGADRIGWRAPDRVELLDAGNLQTRIRIEAQSDSDIDGVCYGTDTLVLLEHGRSRLLGTYRLVRISDGADLPCDLAKHSFTAPREFFSDMHTGYYRSFVANGFATAVNADATVVALACSDGVTRTFRLSDGSLIWESSEIAPQPQALAFAPESNNMVVQDAGGRCSLVSGDDGSLMAATMTSLPPLHACVWSGTSSVLMTYERAGAAGKAGLVYVSTDPHAFGPIIDVPKGVALAPDGNSFVVDDNGTFARFSIIGVDAAADIATTVVEGYELTEAEIAYYQTGGSRK